MADLKTTNIFGDAYINNKVGINTNTPATRLQIGQLSPTAATEGIQFGDDTGARLHRIDTSHIRATGGFSSATYVLAGNYLQTSGNLIYPAGFSSTQRLEVGNAAQNAWIDGLTIAPGGNVTVYNNLTTPSASVSGFITFPNDTNTAGLINAAGTAWLKLDDVYGNMYIVNNQSGAGVYFDSNAYYWRNAAGSTTLLSLSNNGDLGAARYLTGTYINTSDDVSTSNITYIMAKFGDNYHRSATAAKVAAFISGQTMNIAGSSTSCTGNSATATALTSMNISQFTNNSGYLTTAVTSVVAGTGITVSGATGAVTITNSGVTSLSGTTNRITVSGATGAVTLNLPQDIHTGASPSFTGLTVTGITMTNLTGAYQNTTVYDSPRTQSATPSRGIRAPASSIQFTDSYAIAPFYTYRSTGDWPVPYGIGWGTGGESSGIFQRYAANGYSFGDMIFYTGNDGSGAFSFRRHTWEGTTYFAAGSGELNTELFRIDWAGKATAISFGLTGGFVIDADGGYGRFNNWVNLNGFFGLFSGNNNAHIYPNNGSYGSWKMEGTRNGWGGIEFGNNGVSLMMGSDTVGFHQNTNGWLFRVHNGSGFIYKGAWGGGTAATIYDTTNGNGVLLRAAGGPGGYGDWNTFGNVTQTTNFITTEYFNLNGGSGNSNFPPVVSYTYGILTNLGSGGDARAQIYISHAGNDLIFRGGWGTASWQTWNRCLTNVNSPYAYNMNQYVRTTDSPTFATITGTGEVVWSGYNSGNARAVRIGYSGGNYGGISYGINYTATSNSHTYAFNDAVTRIDLADGIQVYSAAGAAANTPVTWSTLLVGYRGNTYLQWKGNNVIDTSYSGTVSGLSIGGNAATATTLQTGRAINGVSFNGSAAITVNGLNYNVNNDWLRENGDDDQFKLYGNSRTMIYRTDGNTNAHGGGAFAHIFYYGGSADANRMFIINTDGRLWSPYHGWLDTMSISGNAATATTLQTARNINGTSFNGSAAITTATWGTARTLTIGSTGKSVDGSAAIAWSLAEIGAAATNQTMFVGTTSVAINRASAGQTLTGVSIDGNAGSADVATYARRVDGATRTSFTVGGNKDNYYPVIFNIGSGATALQYSEFVIERGGYDDPGYTFAGGNIFSTLNIRFSCKSNGWGYGASYENVEMHGYTTQLVANWQQMSEASKLIVWLRGATIYYFWNVVANTTLHDGNSGGTSLTLANAPYYSYTYTSTQTVQTKALYGKYVNSSTGTSGIYVAGNVLAEGLFSGPGTGLTGTASSLSIGGNAATATILQTARNINGTSFNGSAAITTATWGTARTLTIGSTGKSVDGSAAIAWSLAEIGAAATNQTMFIGTTSVAINRASSAITLTGTSIDGNAATATSATSATFLNSSNYIQRIGSSGNYNTDFQNTPAGSVRHQGDDHQMTNNPGGGWWFVDNYRHSNASNYWGTQVAWGWEDNANRLATRNVIGGTFGGWVYYLNSNNYTDYTVTKTGTGASGTWGINITGNAATATTATNVTIANGSVTLAKIENITAYTILGNSNASAAATPAALSVATVATMLSGQTMNINGSSTSCSGTATNATTAGGLAVHTGTNDEANKIVRTQGNGYIMAGWINTISGDNGTTAIDRVYASSDGYIRYYTPANFRTVLDVPTRAGSGASGNWAINITGNAATATLATKASTLSQGGGNGTGMTFNWSGQGGQPTWLWGSNDGTNIYVWNPSNFNVNYATSAGSATSATTAGALTTGNTYTIAGLTSNGTINIFPPYASSYSYFLRMGYDNSGNYDYTVKRNGTTGFLEFNGTQTNYVAYYFAVSGASGIGIGVSPAARLHINGDGTNPPIRIDNPALGAGASNSRGFYGWLPISIGGVGTKYIQLYN